MIWFADSGMLAALHTLAALGRDDRPLSAILADFSRYKASGEIRHFPLQNFDRVIQINLVGSFRCIAKSAAGAVPAGAAAGRRPRGSANRG